MECEMETGQVEAFMCCVREGNFSRAAEVLSLTQPAVSARIALLEAELGGPLFERGGRRLRLTPLGKVFLPHAERGLTSLSDGLHSVKRFIEGKSGSITIAAIDTQALYLLPHPFEQFRRANPSVDVTIRLRIPHDILEMLHDGEVALGLTDAPMWDTSMTIHVHLRERVRLVATRSHPLAQLQEKQGAVRLVEVYHFVVYRVTQNRSVTATVEHIAEEARRGSGGAVIFLPAILAIDLLLQGQGVAFLSENFVQTHIRSGQLVFLNIVDLPPLYNEPVLISLTSRVLDAPHLAFIEIVRTAWQEMHSAPSPTSFQKNDRE